MSFVDTRMIDFSSFSRMPKSNPDSPSNDTITLDYIQSKVAELNINWKIKDSELANPHTIKQQDSDTLKIATPIFRWTDPGQAATFSPVQEWEGYVTEIDDNVFMANLIDKTRDSKITEEIMEFPLTDLSPDDAKMLRIGAIFRWSIGYQKQRGTKTNVSKITFRRLPAWRKDELQDANNRAKQISENLHWD